MKLMTLLCWASWSRTFAAPLKPHESGGVEHIVIINKDHPLPPRVEDVLERLALTDKHPDVRHIYNNSAFQGFAANMKSHCLDLLSNMEDISVVEPAVAIPGAAVYERDAVAYDSRPNAPWGLQRISSAARVKGNTETLDFTYSFTNRKLGYGADIYMIDTGIYTENNVFGGRAKMIWSLDGIMTDVDGHGTHTAGIAGGDTLGVASNANIYGLKALEKRGNGWSSNVIGAIDQVIHYHDIRKATAKDHLGSVMSMSIQTGGVVKSMTHVINAATNHGVHAVVAAGNAHKNACTASPSSAGGKHGPAITVGAITIDAERAGFSNYGECVDVYAPGVDIISSWIGGPNMIKSLSGTSMATPHVTGLVAYAMANATLARNPALMKEWVHMSALSMSDDLLLANNGVRADNSNGFLGYDNLGSNQGYTPGPADDERPPLPTILKRVVSESFKSFLSKVQAS